MPYHCAGRAALAGMIVRTDPVYVPGSIGLPVCPPARWQTSSRQPKPLCMYSDRRKRRMYACGLNAQTTHTQVHPHTPYPTPLLLPDASLPRATQPRPTPPLRAPRYRPRPLHSNLFAAPHKPHCSQTGPTQPTSPGPPFCQLGAGCLPTTMKGEKPLILKTFSI